jgi:histidinol-phosphate aminotransferase
MTKNSNLIKPVPIIQKLLKSQNLGIESYFEEQQNNNQIVFLDKNENPFAPPIEMPDSSELINMVKQYPDPKAVEFLNNLSLKLNIPKSYLFAGSGSDALLDLIIRTYTMQNSIVLGISPSFSMYEFYVKLNGARYVAVPLILRINQETGIALYELDQSNFIQKAKTSKIIILARPNNPDGMALSRNFIIELLKLGKLVIIDEAYIDFSNESNLMDLIKRYENLIILRSFSKSYSLAGLRLGYAVAHPSIINVLTQLKGPYNVNSIALTFGSILLKEKDKIMNNITEIRSLRDEIYHDLLNLQKEYTAFYLHPSEANFVLLRFQSLEIAQSLYEYCLTHNFKLRKFEGQLADCLRISIGTKNQMKRVIEIIKSFFGGR